MNYILKMCLPAAPKPKKSTTRVYRQRPTVCRNLFGPVNHRHTEELLTKQLDEIILTCKKDWDFDFACETPVTGGRYVWEPSEPSRRETNPNLDGCGTASSSTGSVELEHRHPKNHNKHSCTRSRGKRTKVTSSRSNILTSSKSFFQPSIKDYLPVCKRPVQLKNNIIKFRRPSHPRRILRRRRRRSFSNKSVPRSCLELRSVHKKSKRNKKASV